MNHYHFKSGVLLLLLMLFSLTASAQGNRQFSVASFALDQFDMTARNDQYKKVDGNGSLYAIIKVTSNNPEDKLLEYRFDFGNMNHEVVQKDGELWVYVQRNAKFITISRQGFTTINKHDLGATVEEGKVYRMLLSVKVESVQMQMVLFTVNPTNEKAIITVKNKKPDTIEELLGTTDVNGMLAKNLPLGTYTYKILSESCYPTDGVFVLSDKNLTHRENVTLRPRFAQTTLTVDADADIYVNGELKGQRTWKGRLNAGSYNVECRQLSHRSSIQKITIEEDVASSFTLTPPTPVTGSLSVISDPLEANIFIDGQSYGLTPQNIEGLLIGQHSVILSKDGYAKDNFHVTITEGEMTDIKRQLMKGSTNTAEQTTSFTGFQNDGVPMRTNKVQIPQKVLSKIRTVRTIGWIGGATLVTGGVVLVNVYKNGHSHGWASLKAYERVYPALLVVAGVACTTTCCLYSHHLKKSSISLSADLLSDNQFDNKVLGLGFHYRF